jgi:hypothetical protein
MKATWVSRDPGDPSTRARPRTGLDSRRLQRLVGPHRAGVVRHPHQGRVHHEAKRCQCVVSQRCVSPRCATTTCGCKLFGDAAVASGRTTATNRRPAADDRGASLHRATERGKSRGPATLPTRARRADDPSSVNPRRLMPPLDSARLTRRGLGPAHMCDSGRPSARRRPAATVSFGRSSLRSGRV